MKKIGFLGLVFLIFIGCEDVVEVDLPEVDSRLFIDAFIRIDESDPTTRVRVNAGLTSSFFDDIPPADLQNITIVNLDQLDGTGIPSFITLNQTSPGIYEGQEDTSFFTSGRLLLSITHEDQNYAALTNYVPAVPIEQLSQGDETLFSGDETEIIISFIDAPDRQDFYLFDLDFDEYLVSEDLFYEGQRFEFSYFYDDGLDEGEELQISLMGVDIGFYNYMNQLIVQSGGDQGPFQTPTATVRGNIINVTGVDINDIDFENIDSLEEVEGIDPENVREGFPLGYFAVSQSFSSSLIIE
ncbi:DUF4249 family protein [Ulvibacterium sp.]|uniref:DUF4249 family protein n=1 Tax=Ulvibacterium sp. TaxID=2665914 RepID=UPI00262A1DA4|nr:DUF4249 family protein [Ulvibacterium sp.]